MTTKQRIVSALLRLYPAAWRSEYGPELTEILQTRPLRAGVIGDVAWNGLRLRARAAEPSTILGLASMLLMLTGFVTPGGSYSGAWSALLRPSWRMFPTVNVTFMASEFYVLLLVACGCWTYLRHGGRVKSGREAMKMSVIAGIPIMLVAVLLMFGFLNVALLDTGGATIRPSALSILIAPLTRLPEAWIWGSIGGFVGKCIARQRKTTAAIQP
jgi:small-conductance mechanosensitive channel